MKYKFFKVVGLMTGTSMDGIDISLVNTNGIELISLKNFYYKFQQNQIDRLNYFLKKKQEILANIEKKEKADNYISNLHIEALKKFSDKSFEIIGFHGQTIHHVPGKKSIQLGNPNLLSKYFKKKIIYNFRKEDIKNGGQGAPLVPIYHQYLIEKNNLKLPCVFINIGGISNLTYWDGCKLIGFDTGPGNCLLDEFIKIRSSLNFDFNGKLASKGKVNKKLVMQFMKNQYFNIKPPKSLDKLDFTIFFEEFLKSNLSLNDGLATLSEITIKCIISSLQYLPKNESSIIICGGGFKNKFLMKRLQSCLETKILDPKSFNINVDFVESELISFLSARFMNKLPITFPSTTGVCKPMTGGFLINN